MNNSTKRKCIRECLGLLEMLAGEIFFFSYKWRKMWILNCFIRCILGQPLLLHLQQLFRMLFCFLFAICALFSKKFHSRFIVFFIWFAVMNLGNFNDYIPSLRFTTHDYIGEILKFLTIFPMWIMLLIGYPICRASHYLILRFSIND